MPVCCSTCALARRALSAAKSASSIRERAAVVYSATFIRLETVYSNRFDTAPRDALFPATVSIAAVTLVSVLPASDAVNTLIFSPEAIVAEVAAVSAEISSIEAAALLVAAVNESFDKPSVSVSIAAMSILSHVSCAHFSLEYNPLTRCSNSRMIGAANTGLH